jgi:uncharacterized protein
MGLDFYRRAVDLQRKYLTPGRIVANAFQTNGTLIDDEWARFFAANKFLVGISVDGPAEIHDLNRLHAVSGAGSHAGVMRGMDALKRADAQFNVLALVSSANQDKPLEVYRYLKSLGVKYQQYIECVEFDASGVLRSCSVDPVKWGRFLCAIFDEWFKSDTRTVSVRLFDTILAKILDGACSSCAVAEDCRSYFVVESDGGVYPCDFHVRPEYKLGDINAGDFPALLESPLYSSFGARKRAWNSKCAACGYLKLCAGCCPKNRPGGDPSALSALCEGWRIFYAHTRERFEALAKSVREERKAALRMRLARSGASAPDRNAPCPCGSGRKYKKCCGV